jgi:hypothetical protein
MQQPATIRVPTTDRVQPLEEVLLAWLARPAIFTKCLTARDQAEHECPHPYMASHAVLLPCSLAVIARQAPQGSRRRSHLPPRG